MSILDIAPGSNRNTKCYRVSIAGNVFYVSYSTVVACHTEEGGVRIENSWGPTTGRHMKDMGVYGWQIVSEEELQLRIKRAVMRAGLNLALQPLKGTP